MKVKKMVMSSQMSLPIGQNAYFCCWRYGKLLNYIAFITEDFYRGSVWPAYSLHVVHTVPCLLEMLYIRQRYLSLSLLMHDELMHAISHMSTG